MSMKDFIDTLTAEQKQALLEALTDKTSISTPSQPEPTEEDFLKKNTVTEDFTMHRDNSLQNNSRRMPVKAHKNTWTDSGSEAKDIATPDITPTPRTRRPPRKKTVKCHICGKSNQVNASLVYGEFYRCDTCIG